MNSGSKSGHCGIFKMKINMDITSESVESSKVNSINTKSIMYIDKKPTYVNLEKMEENHVKVKSSASCTKGDLNWVHIAISNLKMNLLGKYNSVGGKSFQNYLDKYVYKLNRRYLEKSYLTD